MHTLNDTNMWRHYRAELVQQAHTTKPLILRWPWAINGRSGALGVVIAALMAGLMALMVVGASSPAHAATIFTVTNTTDANNICDAGCSLREAITAANDTPNSGGPDLIRFNILQSGVQTIQPTSELPTITEAVTIDGYSQSGASANTLAKGTNAKIMVELDGSNAGPVADGLQIGASNVGVRGLAINSFDNQGIQLFGDDVSGAKIEGNFIGTDPSGTQDRGNRLGGVHIEGGGNNTIGGAEPGSANTIAFNGLDGVFLISDSSGNRVLRNSIFFNSQLGIDLSGGTQNAAGDTVNDPVTRTKAPTASRTSRS
jgi:CSLREA domain-containing protein